MAVSLRLSQWSLTFEVRKRVIRGVCDQSCPKSQWSLTFEVRKRWQRGITCLTGNWSQWSLTFEVRKSRDISLGIDVVGGDVAMEPDL